MFIIYAITMGVSQVFLAGDENVEKIARWGAAAVVLRAYT